MFACTPTAIARRTRWSRSSGRGSPFSSSAGIEAIVHMSTTSCGRTTSQNRDTLKRRITTSVPPLWTVQASMTAGSA